MDFLALLAHRASAASVVPAAPQGSTVEPVLELLAVLGSPCLDRQAVLLLDLVAVPLRDDVEAAEGDDAEVGRPVVDVTALEPLLVLIVLKVGHDERPVTGSTARMKTALSRRWIRLQLVLLASDGTTWHCHDEDGRGDLDAVAEFLGIELALVRMRRRYVRFIKTISPVWF